ncbi:MAG: chemotaxis protein CheW [Verrucomicrobiales bacterium]|nr:chemotaxis protein CheW [Verrucomicrobiales bacterium]
MPINDELQAQLIKDLLIESTDGLDRFDRELLAIEQGEGTSDTPNIIFRVIHTIKGTAGCLGLTKIESVAHVGENLLSALREGKVSVSQPLISTLLAYADALRQMLRCLEQEGNEGDADFSELLQSLQALLVSNEVPTPAATVPACAPRATPAVEATPEPAEAPAAPVRQVWGLFDDDAVTAPAPASSPEVTATASVAPAAPASVAVPAPAAAARKPAASANPEPSAEKEGGAKGPSAAESAIRVNVEQLDRLMNLVGELVLARNQIIQHCASQSESALNAAAQRLNIITTELQEGVMKTRMQPIGNVWSKFPRIVRDVAHELGKKVQLVMEGKSTELDRTIIEAIKDPLTHIVRNAIDHGIEKPEVRLASNKAEEGTLLMRAYHEGGQVNIEITDDGRGINVARVKQKALEKGLLTAEQAARMTDRDAANIVFLPGFSTAEKVTNVSGRGVGMDVVKTNIEKIGGSVDIQSEEGLGTTIKIKIPLTLAIIPALVVSSGGERFAIPQVNLLELVRLDGGVGASGIETVFDAPVYRLRGRLLPLVFLNRVLNLDESGRPAQSALNLVVLRADGREFGLVVDTINDTEEIVVKPLGKQLKSLSCFAGATIMGDGRVALILDVMGLAQHAQVISENRDTQVGAAAQRSQEAQGDRASLLLFSLGDRGRMAIPLSMAARLEEFPRSKIERAGAREVVQYRGQIMPLIEVSNLVPGVSAAQPDDPMHVVVYSEQGRSVGLVVGRIEDIVEDHIAVQAGGGQGGILGSAVVQGQVTDLLDVKGVIQVAEPGFFEVAP